MTDSNRPAALLLLLAAIALSSTAAEPAFASSSGTTETDEAAPRRIVRLVDGRVLRGPARALDAGAYEVRTRSGLERIDAGAIARARSEREVLSEYARLARGIDARDFVRKLTLAQWLEEEGLANELVKELDSVFALEPDQPRALELAKSRLLADLLPAAEPDATRERARALREAGRAGPTLREAWIARLRALVARDEPAREWLRVTLASDLGQGVDARRLSAARVLRRVLPGAAVEKLEALALDDRSRSVREEARRALRDARDPAVTARLEQRLERSSLRARIGAIDTLAVVGSPASVPALVANLARLAEPKPAAQNSGGGGNRRSHYSLRRQVAYTQDYDLEIAQAASIADPIVAYAEEGVVLDVSTATWQLPVAIEYENALTCRALARIVGEGAKWKPAEWRAWFEKQRANETKYGTTDRPAGETSR